MSVKSAITVTVEGVFKGTVLNLIVQQTNSVLVLENLSASARRDSIVMIQTNVLMKMNVKQEMIATKMPRVQTTREAIVASAE